MKRFKERMQELETAIAANPDEGEFIYNRDQALWEIVYLTRYYAAVDHDDLFPELEEMAWTLVEFLNGDDRSMDWDEIVDFIWNEVNALKPRGLVIQ